MSLLTAQRPAECRDPGLLLHGPPIGGSGPPHPSIIELERRSFAAFHRCGALSRSPLIAGLRAQQAFCQHAGADCDSTMSQLCGGFIGNGAQCQACMGEHQVDLQAANCSESALDRFCMPGIDPRYLGNITVYHVNPASYGSAPVNMNTGDAAGDMFFWAKSVATPTQRGAGLVIDKWPSEPPREVLQQPESQDRRRLAAWARPAQ